ALCDSLQGTSVNFEVFPGLFLACGLENRGLGQRLGFFSSGNRRLEILFLGSFPGVSEGGFRGEPLVAQATGLLFGGVSSRIGGFKISLRACAESRAADRQEGSEPPQSVRQFFHGREPGPEIGKPLLT